MIFNLFFNAVGVFTDCLDLGTPYCTPDLTPFYGFEPSVNQSIYKKVQNLVDQDTILSVSYFYSELAFKVILC